MEFRQLEIFLEVAEQKSFSLAAEKLHLSQSTISTQIISLEQELKTELIHRTTRSFNLTDAGIKLYTYAADLISLKKRAQSEISQSTKKTVQIGTSSVPSVCIVPNLIYEFGKKYPNICYEIIEDSSIQIIDMVSSGKLDLGFVGTKVEHEQLCYTPILNDELVLVTPNKPPYNKQKTKISKENLIEYTFLMRNHSSGTTKEALYILSRLGISENDLKIIAKMNNIEILQQCIIEGLGVSILSKNTVSHWVECGKILTFELEKSPSFRQLYMVFRKSRYTPQMIKLFAQFTKQKYKTL